MGKADYIMVYIYIYIYIYILHSHVNVPCVFLVVQFCELLTDPPFGAVNTTDTLENTTAGYLCILGYILDGDETRVCQRNADTVPGDWTGEEPICASKLYNNYI